MVDKSKYQVDKLLAVMAKLRHPDEGCEWDLAQNFKTVAPYTIEEAYEVAQAIELDDMQQLKSELGDLLFQVVFHSQMAEEQGEFGFNEMVEQLIDKLQRRHPHVFKKQAIGKEGLTKQWEKLKRQENHHSDTERTLLDSVGSHMPAMTRAIKLQKKASGVGFDWPDIKPVFDKLREEVDELEAELTLGNDKRALEELGDVMFSCVNLARHLDADPDWVLRETNQRFKDRFDYIEKSLALKEISWDQASSAQLESLWQEAKQFLEANGR